MVCIKIKRVPEGLRERSINYGNKTKALLQTFGAAKHFIYKKGGSESTKYTNIQSEYVGNLDKIKFLEACIMDYDMRDTFIILTLVDEYAGSVKDCWGKHAAMGVYRLSHWLKVLLFIVAQLHMYSYENCNKDEDIVSYQWKKELFVKSSYPALIKIVEDKYEALGGLDQGGVT